MSSDVERNVPDPRSGVDEQGDWTPAFPGQRPPFQPGHELSVRHGAYSPMRLAPRAAELAEEIRVHVPGYRPADEIAVQALALTLSRIEAADAAITQVDALLLGQITDEGRQQLRAYIPKADPDLLAHRFQSLRDDLKGWIRLMRQQANDLGLTPTSRARLGVDVANARRAVTLTELAAEADEERRRGDGEGS